MRRYHRYVTQECYKCDVKLNKTSLLRTLIPHRIHSRTTKKKKIETPFCSRLVFSPDNILSQLMQLPFKKYQIVIYPIKLLDCTHIS